MIVPRAEEVLGASIRSLSRILPDEALTPVVQFELRALRTVLAQVARGYDTAVPDRLEDIESLKAILSRAASVLDDPALKRTITDSLAREGQAGSDLRLSALDAAIDRMNGVLIDVQAALEETAPCPAIESLIKDIWTHLARVTGREALDDPGHPHKAVDDGSVG